MSPTTLEIEPVRSAQDCESQRAVASAAADQLLADVLQSLEDEHPMELEDVVARIKAIPPNPANLRHAEPGLADVLLHPGEEQMAFDEAAWNAEWAKVEAELNRLSD